MTTDGINVKQCFPTSFLLPQVNLNGTDRDTLVEQNWNAAKALRVALGALNLALPNARDFQLRPSEYELARQLHIERAQALEAMARVYETITLQLAEGG